VAAIKRSRRRMWLLVLLVLAIVLGFVFVRFFIGPADPRSERAASAGTLASRPAPFPKGLPWMA
jgi:uncharacterized protein involved in outer membrane biogenesis